KNLYNNMTDAERNIAYKTFLNISQRKFEKYNFRDMYYLERLGHSDDRDGFLNAIKDNYPEKKRSDQIILIPKKNAFQDRFQASIGWIFGVFAISCSIIFLMIAIPKIDDTAYKRFQKKQPLKEDSLKDLYQFLDPRGAFKGTSILILANIIVFIGMVIAGFNIISPTPQELLEIGGNRRPEVLNGEYWRLFTATFIHGGVAHLIFNLVGIGLGGVFLERIVGSLRLLCIYIVCGVLASIASVYWHENTISVGASGAIFGLYGALLSFLIFNIIPKYDQTYIWRFLGIFGGISLLFGLLSSGTDNAGHFGGLISGFFVGMLLIAWNRKKLEEKAS
ncbi:MAG: rhomboid family intramembrane serine protease, partial [Bacteroidota bacterium]